MVSNILRKPASLASAALLVVASGLPILANTATASAAQVTSRSIKMSTSKAGASSVSYLVSFNVPSTSLIRGIVLDFCTSPLIGTSCTAPTGLSTSGTPTVTDFSIGSNTGLSWTYDDINSSTTNVSLTNTTGVTPSANDTVTFTVTSMTNPSSNGTFYARVLTYGSTTGATGYVAGTEGSYIDYGGFALSAAAEIDITAKVRETLTFCIYKTSSASCPGSGGSSLVLGDGDGVLESTTTTYTADAYYSVATNAQSGVNVRMKGGNLCRDLTRAACADGDTANTISAYAGTCTANSGSSSVEQFGMRVVSSVGTTAQSPYACSAGSYTFDTTSLAGTYGQTIASSAGPVDLSENQMTFAAKSANTTDAGIYKTTLTFIATGTY